jgi:hypothetical protein
MIRNCVFKSCSVVVHVKKKQLGKSLFVIRTVKTFSACLINHSGTLPLSFHTEIRQYLPLPLRNVAFCECRQIHTALAAHWLQAFQRLVRKWLKWRLVRIRAGTQTALIEVFS